MADLMFLADAKWVELLIEATLFIAIRQDRHIQNQEASLTFQENRADPCHLQTLP